MTLLQIAADSLTNEIVPQNTDELMKMLEKFSARFIIDLLSVFLLIRLIYYRIYKNSEYFFTYFIFNIVIFLISFLLNKVELSMGAAFGLFAVFSMLRYRTEDISIKDMTYLFLVIAMGLIAAVTKIKNTSDAYEYVFLGLINLLVIVVTYLIETNVFFKKELSKIVNYDNIDLIKEENRVQLIEDLKKRTGMDIHRISIGKVDFLKDSSQIKVYYYEKK